MFFLELVLKEPGFIDTAFTLKIDSSTLKDCVRASKANLEAE